jgi:hypothetical protein
VAQLSSFIAGRRFGRTGGGSGGAFFDVGGAAAETG